MISIKRYAYSYKIYVNKITLVVELISSYFIDLPKKFRYFVDNCWGFYTSQRTFLIRDAGNSILVANVNFQEKNLYFNLNCNLPIS